METQLDSSRRRFNHQAPDTFAAAPAQSGRAGVPVVLLGPRTAAIRAAESILRADGWSILSSPRSEVRPLLVIEAVPEEELAAHRTLLICGPSAIDARVALDALLRGRIGGFASSDELVDLPPLLEALCRGRVALTRSSFDRGRSVPSLTEREAAVLTARLSGLGSNEVALQLGVSAATVKRDTVQLCDAFRVGNVPQLVAKAARLGYGRHSTSGPGSRM